MSRILDKRFKYTPSHATDVRKTIKREQERLRKEREAMEHRDRNILKIKRAA